MLVSLSLGCCVLLLEYFTQIFRPHVRSQNLNQLSVTLAFRNMKQLLTGFLGDQVRAANFLALLFF